MKRRETFRFFIGFCIAAAVICLMTGSAYANRTNKMFDVPQDKRPEWGKNWCAPTAVGNSFAWLAKEYPSLAGLAKVGGTGPNLSAEEMIDYLGSIYMNTSPTNGTTAENIEKGKKDYIRVHGLANKITVETKKNPTKRWIKEQYDKGQDVEFGFGRYVKVNGKWERVNGHVMVYGSMPGEDVGGHVLSLTDITDPFNNDNDTDFYISFTDPGRDDLTGQFGAINHEQYSVTDAAGVNWFSTSSTYAVLWDADLFGAGLGGYLLNGYQGAGDFGAGNAPERTTASILEYAWAESPVPAPGAILLGGIGVSLIGWLRRRRML